MHGLHPEERKLRILNILRGRRSATASDIVQDDAGWESTRTGAELLATPYRQQLLRAIQESTSLTAPVFEAYVKEPLQRYAERVQLLPASESHHHSYPGGMLDHGLETCVFGLRLRRQHLLPPKESPEKQSSTGELWSVAVIYACLLHDIAKVLVDVDIHLRSGRRWCLWEGIIPDQYRVRYIKGRDYFLHAAANPLLCKEVIGNPGLEWLRSQPELFGLVMYTISGHTERSGVVGEIVSQADRASVAKSLGGKVSNIDKAPRESLQSKLKGAICHIVTEKIRLNEKGAQGFVTPEALWLVTPLVPREIKSYLLSHGIEGVPSNESRLYDEMQSHGLIIEIQRGVRSGSVGSRWGNGEPISPCSRFISRSFGAVMRSLRLSRGVSSTLTLVRVVKVVSQLGNIVKIRSLVTSLQLQKFQGSVLNRVAPRKSMMIWKPPFLISPQAAMRKQRQVWSGSHVTLIRVPRSLRSRHRSDSHHPGKSFSPGCETG